MNAPLRRRAPDVEPSAGSAVAAFIGAHRAGLGAVAVVVAAAVGGWLLWRRHAADVQAHPDLVLFPERVAVRGVAPWVHGDLRDEALRDASLDGGLPLDDPGLPERLRRAFARHPWVREVVSVSVREPAAASVEVRCREPVAMVRVRDGLYPVDAEGVVLPTAGFTSEAAAAYPTIANVTSAPLGAAGSAWGDPLVVEGAAVAAVVGPEWPRLRLRDLVPVAAVGGIAWEFVGDQGRTVRFGSAPGRERDGEPAAAAKLSRLRGLAADESDAGPVDLTKAAPEAPTPISDPAPTPAPP